MSCVWTYLNYKSLCFTWTCLHNRALICTWTCLDNRSLTCSWSCQHYRYRCVSCTWTYLVYRNLCCNGRVYTTKACAAFSVSTPQGPELHLNLSGQEEPLLLLDVSALEGLSCTWTCLFKRSLCISWTSLHYTGPELHLDLYGQGFSWTCLHLRAWAAPGLVYSRGAYASPGRLYTIQGLSCTWTCLDNRSLCFSRTCLHCRVWATPGLVWTTGAAPGRVYTTGPELHLEVSTPKMFVLAISV